MRAVTRASSLSPGTCGCQDSDRLLSLVVDRRRSELRRLLDLDLDRLLRPELDGEGGGPVGLPLLRSRERRRLLLRDSRGWTSFVDPRLGVVGPVVRLSPCPSRSRLWSCPLVPVDSFVWSESIRSFVSSIFFCISSLSDGSYRVVMDTYPFLMDHRKISWSRIDAISVSSLLSLSSSGAFDMSSNAMSAAFDAFE
jgi:hypothetical protein